MNYDLCLKCLRHYCAVVLARAIHSLAKIGEELYIDPCDEGLAFRTVNSNRAAFVSYTFKPSFFSSYSHKLVADLNNSRLDIATSFTQRQSQKAKESNENNNETIDDSKCKVTMRVSKSYQKVYGNIFINESF